MAGINGPLFEAVEESIRNVVRFLEHENNYNGHLSNDERMAVLDASRALGFLMTGQRTTYEHGVPYVRIDPTPFGLKTRQE